MSLSQQDVLGVQWSCFEKHHQSCLVSCGDSDTFTGEEACVLAQGQQLLLTTHCPSSCSVEVRTPASLRRGLCCLVLELHRSVGTTRWPPLFIFGACVLVTLLRFPHLLGTRSWVFFVIFFLLLFFNQFQKKMICVKGVKIEFIYDKLKLRRRIPEEATGS